MSASPAPTASPEQKEKKAEWKEYKNSDGRVYWAHSMTKVSVWEKPDELKTPFERALNQTVWKQYTSKGRPYYVNSKTKETKWDLPEELMELKEIVEAEGNQRREGQLVTLNGRDGLGTPAPRGPGMQVGAYGDSGSGTPLPAKPEKPDLPPFVWPQGGFRNKAEAEDAFLYLLKKEGIDETWTWDTTMRTIITDPLYKVLETLAEKKAVWQKYTSGLVEAKRAEREAYLAKLRPHVNRALAAKKDLKSYHGFASADRIMANERSWRQASEEDRRTIFEEYISKLRQKEAEQERELQRRNNAALAELVRGLDLDVATRWRAAHEMILSSPVFKADPLLQKIDTLDMLAAYEDRSRELEREHDDVSRKEYTERSRRGRRARDGFKALLGELVTAGKLTRKSTWKETLPLIEKDERYDALLGMHGSSPMDLWMDLVDDLGEEAERVADTFEKALKGIDKKFVLETTFKEFTEMAAEVPTIIMDDKVRADVYDLIHTRLIRAAQDETRRLERRRRHQVDDLRHALGKVDAIDLNKSYDEALPLIKDLPEFAQLDHDESRKLAFDKFVRRQKEKLREAASSDGGSATSRRRREPESRRHAMDVDDDHERRSSRRDRDDRYREKDRSHRSSRDDRERDRDRGDKDRSDRDRRSSVHEKTVHKEREKVRYDDDAEEGEIEERQPKRAKLEESASTS